MPFCNKYLRLPDKGIDISSVNASQSLRPVSHSLCSVIAPMLWMWMKVFWSMIGSISGFCRDLKVAIECRLPLYHDAAILCNIFENFSILFFKFKISELLESVLCCQILERYWVEFRYCNPCCNLMIIAPQEVGVAPEWEPVCWGLEKYFLDLKPVDCDICNFVRVWVPSTYL